MVKKILIGLVIALIILQAFRPERNKGNAFTAHDITHTVKVPDTVMHLLQASCYDCHSNHTNYPWYTNINPVGLWLQHHVNEGKDELNFSEFGKYSHRRGAHKMDELVEQLQRHEMPLNSYLWVHHEAKLSEAQSALIINWASEAKEMIADSTYATHPKQDL